MASNNSSAGRDLPIYTIEHQLLADLTRIRRLIIQAPTGSGKSTQVPQMLLSHGASNGQILVLQPRRLPARMLADRVARECGTRLGDKVGYQIRFEDHSCRDTKIKFVTEGILLRQMLSDPCIRNIGTIIFDEFHERHLYGDVTLGRALQLQQSQRPDLQLIVMSATLDSNALSDYLFPCNILRTEGRTYPVTIEYLARQPDPRKVPVWDLAATELTRLLSQHTRGDVLIFMPGSYEIMKTMNALRAAPATRSFEILPLHGELPPQQQDAAVARYDRRKIVVSTNVAETSLTIDGITLVIDSGLARIARFDPNRGINTLLIDKISKASADQRTGRAGRTAPGHCLRLWTHQEHEMKADRETPEIRRVDLSEMALTLKAGGISDLRAFPWLEPPEPRALDRAEALLRDLGAIDKTTGSITQLGNALVAFPVHPRYARMLLAADHYKCVPSVALIAALTQDRNLLLSRQGEQVTEQRERKIGDDPESDFIALMRAWQYADQHDYDLETCKAVGIHANAARQVGKLYHYFLRIAGADALSTAVDNSVADSIAKCILFGFSDQLACRLHTGTLRCDMVHARRGELAKESTVRKSPLFVACEVREVESRNKELHVILSLATRVKLEWLTELFPDDLKEDRNVFFDSAINRVVVEQKQLFRDLVIGKKQSGQPTEHEAAAILADEVMAGRLIMKMWDHTVEQWLKRANCLAVWCPDLGIPTFTDEDRKIVLQQACLGAYSYKEIKDRPVMSSLKSWLSDHQRALIDRHVPERLTLANGRQAKVTYARNLPPSISLPIQSLYGVNESPRVAMNNIGVIVNVLAPSHRPVQVTQDMRGFWTEHYPRLKKELQRKYPKHEWR